MSIGCTVFANRHGNLALRLYWAGLDCREGTALKDTPENRRKLEAQAYAISQQINNGTFMYLDWFPNGNKAGFFKGEKEKPRHLPKLEAMMARRQAEIAFVRSLYPAPLVVLAEQPQVLSPVAFKKLTSTRKQDRGGLLIADFAVFDGETIIAIFEVGTLTHRDKLQFWATQFPQAKVFWVPKCPFDYMPLVAIPYELPN